MNRMKIKTTGVILKISETAPGNRLLFLLTPEYGRLQAFENFRRGAKGGAADLFAYGEFVLYKSKDSYNINSFTPLESFFPLREDMRAFALANYLAQLALYATQDETVFFPSLLPMMLNSLHLLCKEDKPYDKVKTVFEWKVAESGGFLPTLQLCDHADFENPTFFSVTEGGIFCDECAGGALFYPVSVGMVQAISHIFSSDIPKAFSFRLPEDRMAALAKISEAYLLYHSGRDFSALDFYNMMKE